MIRRFAYTVAGAALGLAIGLSGAAGASNTPATARIQCSDQAIAGGIAEHHASGKVSLWHWAQAHHMYVSAILRDTLGCQGGGWAQVRQFNYFDRREAYTDLMPRGMRFYSGKSSDF